MKSDNIGKFILWALVVVAGILLIIGLIKSFLF